MRKRPGIKASGTFKTQNWRRGENMCWRMASYWCPGRRVRTGCWDVYWREAMLGFKTTSATSQVVALLLDPSAAKCARKRRPGRYRRDKNSGQQQ